MLLSENQQRYIISAISDLEKSYYKEERGHIRGDLTAIHIYNDP